MTADEKALRTNQDMFTDDYPLNNPKESHFGLVRSDGSLKPAASVLHETFTRCGKP